jgi:hypothetical protein
MKSLAGQKMQKIILNMFIIIITFWFFQLSEVSAGTTMVAPGQAVGDIMLLNAGESNSDVQVQFFGDAAEFAGNPNKTCYKRSMLVVEGRGRWRITVSADTMTRGYMAEYDTAISQYVSGGKKLSSSMKIRTQDGNAVDLSQGGELASGEGKKTYTLSFEQPIAWEDEPLPPGREYHITITLKGEKQA